MVLMEYNGRSPKIDQESYVSPLATLIGDVTVNNNAIIWPGAIIRGENAPVIIGEYSTIFNGVLMFTRSQKSAINIGRYCIIESGVSILGCFMEDYVQIMEGTLIYEEVSIGEGSIIMTNSQVPPGFTIAARSVVRGIPIEPIKEQTRNDVLKQKERAEHYSQLFVKILSYLPNAQSYLLTLPDFIKLMLNKEKE